MATVELGSLAQHLEDEEVATIFKALKKNDVTFDPGDHDTVVVAKNLDGDMIADFVDRLDAHDAGADLYLPVEFDGVVRAGGIKVGSAPMLVTVLEDMKEELLAEDDDDDEEDESDDDDEYDDEEEEDEDDEYEAGASGALRYKDDQLRDLWKVLYKAAAEAVNAGTVLFLKT
jgi:hypothetical protein